MAVAIERTEGERRETKRERLRERDGHTIRLGVHLTNVWRDIQE
jgi:hypothetical protein